MSAQENWIDVESEAIIAHVNDSNKDNTCKPNIVNLILEDSTQIHQISSTFHSSIDNHPMLVTDSAGYELQYPTIQTKDNQQLSDVDVDQIGAVFCDNDPNEDDIDDDLVLNVLQASQKVLNSSWVPSLNTIVEESTIDLKTTYL